MGAGGWGPPATEVCLAAALLFWHMLLSVLTALIVGFVKVYVHAWVHGSFSRNLSMLACESIFLRVLTLTWNNAQKP
jgi:fatty acid desaturase